MALIKCTECGKEISDKAPACINCGCPVSAMKAETAKPAGSQTTNNGFAGFSEAFGDIFGGNISTNTQKSAPSTTYTQHVNNGTITTKAEPKPVEEKRSAFRPVPKAIPDMKILPGVVVQCIDKLCGVVGLAGFTALGGIIAGFLSGFPATIEMYGIAVLGLAGNQILAYITMLMEFWHVKRYLKKNLYADSIRYDDAYYSNSIAAFKLNSTKMMARYIKKLNPNAGAALEKGIKKAFKEKRQKRIASIPYIIALMAVYYLLPRLEATYILPYESSLIICHVVTFIAMFIYERRKGGRDLGIVLLLAALFAPTIFAYFISEMWYHIAICAAAAFLGLLAGTLLPKKK